MTTEIGSQVRQIGRDPEAFTAFYRAHLQAVQRFVARRVGDPHLVADLTADVFIAASSPCPWASPVSPRRLWSASAH